MIRRQEFDIADVLGVFMRRSVCVCAAFFAFYASTLSAQEVAYNYGQIGFRTPGSELQRLLYDGGSVRIDGVSLNQAELRRFYVEKQFGPAWVEGSKLNRRGATVLNILEHAGTEGLNPSDYYLSAIHSRIGTHDLRRQGELDVLLTGALIRYISDLRTGRIDPASLRGIHYEKQEIDAVLYAVGATRAADVANFIRSFAPSHPDYTHLRNALAEHRQMQAAGGWVVVPKDGPVLHVGETHEDIIAIRKRLQAEGILKRQTRRIETLTVMPMKPAYSNSLTYVKGTAGQPKAVGVRAKQRHRLHYSSEFDESLKEKVIEFQEARGLSADGVIGPQTRAAFGGSIEERIDLIIANMERLRWLPDDLGRRHVFVNVPAFRLGTYENGHKILDMPVIVGRKKRQTPIFHDEIEYMEFNPTWTVPTSIAVKDMLPHLRDDPYYLTNKGIRLYSDWGRDAVELDPSLIDWNADWLDVKGMRMTQMPGSGNALGKVKFMFPNEFDVYLHDTPEQHKFKRAVRTFSSGCVRVAEPMEMAGYLVSETPEWAEEGRWRDLLDRSGTRRLTLDQHVPVWLFYKTVTFAEDGATTFHDDIYGYDADLLQALKNYRQAQARQVADNR